MRFNDVTLTLIEDSMAGYSEQAFPLQVVDIDHEGDEISCGLDGITSVGGRPHVVFWHGGEAQTFATVMNVAIVSSNGKPLLAGELCKNFEAPRDVDGVVRFEVLRPD
ncbi:hypothetical protein BMW22_35750 (plasmid) [Rhizobium leguminosarum]|uniref:Uncharacterized protein n=2 Tax=Rhizobium/Agrobacterium group TaxID=227290 RepID=A0A1B1CPJ6_RHILE|nr:hypothetical protein BA011_36940 [Rhizobium leguminosarum]API56776.1 hypothetical protein BMW22_35750 [Rhizobium leguminosarum]